MQVQNKIPVEQLAQGALTFIDRTQISAQEAESMVLVKNWLRSFLQPPQTNDDGDGERAAPLRAVGRAGESDTPKEAA